MSCHDVQSMSLSDFERWDVTGLKDYLRKRGLKVSGNKATLVARSFSAWEQQVSVVPDWEAKQMDKLASYHTLLQTDEGLLPDPFKDIAPEDWQGEEAGMSSWPPVMLSDISDYLKRHETHTETASMKTRLLKDYKEQKAYSYFSSQWLFEVKIYSVNAHYKFLKSQCRPSQRVSEPPHDVWVCTTVDGNINSAYSTCFAGLGQSCNHIAALLLKVDYCWRYGLINKACTSKPCVWTSVKGKNITEPRKFCEMTWKKPSATRLNQQKIINPPARTMFTPLESQPKRGMSLETFFERLAVISPNSVILAERREGPVKQRVTNIPAELQKPVLYLPPPLATIAERATSVEDFLQSLPVLNKEEIQSIEKETRGQSNNKLWFSQRQGSLTSSSFHDIYTRVETLKKSGGSAKKLVQKLTANDTSIEHLPAIKYGKEMESIALQRYRDILKDSGHKNISCTTCGLFVHPEQSFLRASPDSLVSCSCCGNGCVEVKCPLTSAHRKPCPETVSYLKYDQDGKVTLNRNHKYFDQIVGQLAVTGRQWCDFLVFSMHGHHIERIFKEEAALRWDILVINLQYFFKEHLAPELVNRCDQPVSSVRAQDTTRKALQTSSPQKRRQKIRRELHVYQSKPAEKNIYL